MILDDIDGMLEQYKEEIEADIKAGLSLMEISIKYSAKARREMFPKTFIGIIQIPAPEFATEENTIAMLKRKFPLVNVISVVESPRNMLVEVVFHQLSETPKEKIN